MTPYEKLKTVRTANRFTASRYVDELFEKPFDLYGDRCFGEDSAIRAGIGYLNGIPVTYIATEKGDDIQSRMRNNFGCPRPEGYRKAIRLMKQAEKFHRPVICLVDTLGAFCGLDAEERGQGQAIASSITTMLGLKTPVLSLIVGEGGSGGALALCSADRIYMLENAVYSVISPDGCASILWKDSSRTEDAADSLRITAQDMEYFGVADAVIQEDYVGFRDMCQRIADQMEQDLAQLYCLTPEELVVQRHRRFRKYGFYNEYGTCV